jgi:hypothetical protein
MRKIVLALLASSCLAPVSGFAATSSVNCKLLSTYWDKNGDQVTILDSKKITLQRNASKHDFLDVLEFNGPEIHISAPLNIRDSGNSVNLELSIQIRGTQMDKDERAGAGAVFSAQAPTMEVRTFTQISNYSWITLSCSRVK